MGIYPNLEGAIASRGVRKTAIASGLNISKRALYNKLNGTAPITWEEACAIQSIFFPDFGKDYLFSKAENVSPKAG